MARVQYQGLQELFSHDEREDVEFAILNALREQVNVTTTGDFAYTIDVYYDSEESTAESEITEKNLSWYL